MTDTHNLPQVYSVILQGSEATEQNAIDYANGFVWSEADLNEPDNGAYFRQISGMTNVVGVFNGVGVYYDFAADYYFFTDESK